jgi:hypothetical protein
MIRHVDAHERTDMTVTEGPPKDKVLMLARLRFAKNPSELKMKGQPIRIKLS